MKGVKAVKEVFAKMMSYRTNSYEKEKDAKFIFETLIQGAQD